jgi:hypothetical protein
MTNTLQQYRKVRSTLEKERAELGKRMAEIDEALGVAQNGHHTVTTPAQHSRPRRNQHNKLSLREAISIATKSRPLSKAEIIEAVNKLGYRFSTDDPTGSLNACLYSKQGKKNFTNHGGKFSAK